MKSFGLTWSSCWFLQAWLPSILSTSTQDFPKALKWPSSGFQHHYNNWFWIWRYYQLAPLLPVYPPLPHDNRWFCWINCRWTQDYSRPHPFKIAKNQILSILSPHRVLTLHVNKTVIDKDTQHKILKYFVIYAMILLSLIFIVSLDSNDFLIVTSCL